MSPRLAASTSLSLLPGSDSLPPKHSSSSSSPPSHLAGYQSLLEVLQQLASLAELQLQVHVHVQCWHACSPLLADGQHSVETWMMAGLEQQLKPESLVLVLLV